MTLFFKVPRLGSRSLTTSTLFLQVDHLNPKTDTSLTVVILVIMYLVFGARAFDDGGVLHPKASAVGNLYL